MALLLDAGVAVSDRRRFLQGGSLCPGSERCQGTLVTAGFALAFCGFLGACRGSDVELTRAPVVERIPLGDTLLVLNRGEGAWAEPRLLRPVLEIGEVSGVEDYLFGRVIGLTVDTARSLYVYDAGVGALRKYDDSGRFVMAFGTRGQGPGEHLSQDGGMAVLPDGRLLLRDDGNARIQVWSSDGTPADTWPLPGGPVVFVPPNVDSFGRFFTAEPDRRMPSPRPFLVVSYDPASGTATDTLATLPVPQRPNVVTAGGVRLGVPFIPQLTWSLGPNGSLAMGDGLAYSIDVIGGDGTVLRVSRDLPRVAVDPEEKEDVVRYVTNTMREVDPRWVWNGPDIPDEKAAFTSLFLGRDGRLWVQVSQAGRKISQVPDPFVPNWEEPVLFDLFDADGAFLGPVSAPDGFATYPAPVFDGDTVWALTRDHLGVERVVRFVLTDVPEG